MIGCNGGECDAGQAALAIVARSIHKLTGRVIEFDLKNAEAMDGPDFNEYDEEPGPGAWVRRKHIVERVLFVAQLADSMDDGDLAACMKSVGADLKGDEKALTQMAKEGGMTRAQLGLPKKMESYPKIEESERIKLCGDCAAVIDAFAGVPLEQSLSAEVDLLLAAIHGIPAKAVAM
jgi:hypothetical protein